jgi:hypothetical protein
LLPETGDSLECLSALCCFSLKWRWTFSDVTAAGSLWTWLFFICLVRS